MAAVTGLAGPGVGRALREARIAAGYSQHGLARALGCSQAAIASWEQEKRAITLDRLPDLAAVLRIPAWVLVARIREGLPGHVREAAR